MSRTKESKLRLFYAWLDKNANEEVLCSVIDALLKMLTVEQLDLLLSKFGAD